MKKYSLLAISLLFAFMANAQLFNIAGVDVGYLYVGPKLGGNASFNSMDANTGTEKKANYGYQFGGVAKFGISEKLSIQPELIFSSKGVKHEGDIYTSSANTKYFGIPIIAKYAFIAISGVDIYGSGGFYTDYLTGMVHIEEYEGQPDFEEKVTDLSTFNRVDFGLNFGGGAIIPLKNKDILNIDLRLTVGLTNFVKDNSAYSSRNTSIQLSAVYLVDLTKWVHFRGNSTKKSGTQEQNSVPAGNSKVDRTNE
jgi:hypothetical protein